MLSIDYVIDSLVTSRRVDLQHVGNIQSDFCCCVNMKLNRASVHREARFNLRGCANQLNNDTDNHVIMQMGKSTSVRSQRHQQRCHSIFCDQSTTTATTTIQQSIWPAKAVSTTMLHVLYLSALYLVIATHVCISSAATVTTTTATTVTNAKFVSKNNLSEKNASQQHGAVYAALSGANSNLPTTNDPGEWNLYHTNLYTWICICWHIRNKAQIHTNLMSE